MEKKKPAGKKPVDLNKLGVTLGVLGHPVALKIIHELSKPDKPKPEPQKN